MDSERAKELISKFRGKKILVVGDVMLDRYVFGNVERLNPEAPVPVLHAKEEKQATGGAGNTAKNVATLGGKAILVGAVGTGVAAQRVETAARGEGYEARLVKDARRPTTEKIRYMVRSQQMLRVDYEEKHDIEGNIESEIISSLEAGVGGVDAIIVSDYAKGVVTEKVASAVIRLAKSKNLSLMADVKPSRANWFTGATWLSPNRKEAFEFLGMDQFDDGGISDEQLAMKLRDKFGATVFLTLSGRGVFVAGKTEQTHVPQEHEIQVADTSGAGDTAQVAIVLAKLSGASDVEAAQLANAAGAVVVSKVGAVGVTQKELLNMLKHQHD